MYAHGDIIGDSLAPVAGHVRGRLGVTVPLFYFFYFGFYFSFGFFLFLFYLGHVHTLQRNLPLANAVCGRRVAGMGMLHAPTHSSPVNGYTQADRRDARSRPR